MLRLRLLQTLRRSPGVAHRFVHSTLGADATIVAQPFKNDAGKLLRVSLTETAVAKLNKIKHDDNRPDLHLRIKVESGGCHGFQYIFDLKDKDTITSSDSIFTRDGAQVVIDHESLKLLQDSTVDYATELIGSQFKVTSPHTSSACGCGSSFSLDP
ncbi:Iron-sulfur cluster insertion protein ErpA [Wickerhamiella sorbophila]|uniref:Iron-sulfur cluster insertion protein ErpA n=1 Tax=Wickerhamiella sorbophila TaxID=45607 RepID=A0A2T0FCE9_9ASCO|nr:Iron-sulfur cluster insertion protein ErpA [Wickerhamiella sorbophila]PRT52683.1 Iron-sulfur cluster insertion protein ErpA [Wickerhamiella sorbophila]